jgi:NAD(P)-dependent dehydrogenase (short-subunit alcohol dehydrogenase family)
VGRELAKKVAIITGGASGLGLATAELFVKEGAKVVLADINAEKGAMAAAELGESARFIKANVTVADEVQAAVDFAVAEFGGLNVIMNNAGIGGKFHDRFINDDLADYRAVIDSNLLGVMLGSQRAARYMKDHGGGSIINTTSTAATLAGFGVMAYRSAKAAVTLFSRSIAIDFAEYNIRVNCIAPGQIQTPMTTYAEPGMAPDVAARVARATEPVMDSARPLKRKGTPEDVAQAALFLASDRSQYTTGATIPVDGGVLAGDPVNHMRNILAARARAVAGEE